MDNKNNDSFNYTYSAREAEEIKRIRQKYAAGSNSDECDKLTRLRKLDAGVGKKATALSIALGVISCLVLGFGMSAVMEFRGSWFIPGIIIGLVGIVGTTLAYPLYLLVIKRERKKIAPEVLKLTDDLLK